jgi:hypothetical protein
MKHPANTGASGFFRPITAILGWGIAASVCVQSFRAETAAVVPDAALLARQQVFACTVHSAAIAVAPIEIVGTGAEARASDLAGALSRAGLGRTSAIAAPLPADETEGPRGAEAMNALQEFTRGAQAFARRHAAGADYVLCVRYRVDPRRWENAYALLVLCDTGGEIVLTATLDNSDPRFRMLRPVSVADFHALVVHRLADAVDEFLPPRARASRAPSPLPARAAFAVQLPSS